MLVMLLKITTNENLIASMQTLSTSVASIDKKHHEPALPLCIVISEVNSFRKYTERVEIHYSVK